MHWLVGIGLFLLLCVASSTREGREEARARMRPSGRVAGAFAVVTVIVLVVWDAVG